METLYPALTVITPLIFAFVVGIVSWINKKICFWLALLSLIVAFISSLKILFYIITTSSIVQYKLGGWPPPIGIEYRIDWLNGLILPIISFVALLNLIASKRFMEKEFKEKESFFYILYLLFTTGLLGVVITGDLFNLYVLLEITSLTAYSMIAMGGTGRSYLASLNYLFLGVIGASFYLLGVGYVYIKTGSLNMVDVFRILPHIYNSETVLVGFIFCMVGVWIKMGLFPLHTWLPNAYTFSPISVSRIIAPLMTKVMIYVMIRVMFSVFGRWYVLGRLYGVNEFVVLLASCAIIVGGILALSQRDIRKVLCYIIVSEIGYMVGGAWLGNPNGLIGAILHILNDMLMTFCLFLAFGNVFYTRKKTKIEDLKGLFGEMPYTSAGLVLVGLSIIGIPPTCGFFSKWYLILGALQAKDHFFAVSLILSSLINVILFFRFFEIGLFSKASYKKEAPVSMIVPLFIVSLMLIVVGICSGSIVNKIINEFVLVALG